jgi:transposase
MMQRHDLTEEQWTRLEPLLPRSWRGPQPRDLRRTINGILWILRTGAPWRDLPTCYGSWQTAASRCYRWRAVGIWDTLLATRQQHGDAAGQLGWSAHLVNGDVIHAHQHSAGARRVGGKQAAQALGRSHEGFSAKLHLCAEWGGKPITFLLTPGQRHDQSAFGALVDRGAVKRAGRGRPRLRPKQMVGDKGYRSGKARHMLRRRRVTPMIPPKSTERHQPCVDRERHINRLKRFRRSATRYEGSPSTSWRWSPSLRC